MRGLELSICRLAEKDDPRILVQALAAVRVLEAAWAESMVLSALAHPHMGVKKEAAAALTQMATAAAVPTLVEWLAHHDNHALRASLCTALRRAAGPSYVAVLVDALEREAERRRIDLLHGALRGALPLRAAVRLARSERLAHRRLLEACLDGSVVLRDGDRDALAARLHRARVHPEEPPRDPGRRLRVEGFDPEAARALLKERRPEDEASVLATVRQALAEWIGWLSSDGVEPEPDALALVFDAAQARHEEHVERLLALAERHRESVEAGAVGLFIERCVARSELPRLPKLRALVWLREAAPSSRLDGLRRWRLLRRLGAVRGFEDLWRCLEDCRAGPQGGAKTRELLLESLQVPQRTPDESPALVELREEIERVGGRPEHERRAWLEAVVKRRPLDLPVADAGADRPRPRFVPATVEDRSVLLAALAGEDEHERSVAASRLLAWPEAHDTWPRVLDAFLEGRVSLAAEHRAGLAPLLRTWPTPLAASDRAAELLQWCSAWQYRGFVREWIEAWETGDPRAEARLRATPEALLVPWVLPQAQQGDGRRARLLSPSGSLAVRSIIELLRDRSPADIEHLLPKPPESAPDDAEDPVDPLAGLDPDQLVALIERKGVAKGLAVRAVHALVGHAERAEEPLSRLATDRRPPVRSAALRALRKVAPREVSLAAAARVLSMETRRDVMLSLMKSLGHGRHEPSLSALIERLEHRDVRVRQGAHDAIMAWGTSVLPALRRATRKARPDRRPALRELAAALEGSQED